MNFEQPVGEQKPQNIEGKLPFLKSTPEEKHLNSELRRANKMMIGGKMDEAIDIINELKKNKPPKREFTQEQEAEFDKASAELLEGLGYTIEKNEGSSLECKKDNYDVEVRHMMIPDLTGYEGGRVFEMYISQKSKLLLHIDGDNWDVKPKKEEVKKMFEELMSALN